MTVALYPGTFDPLTNGHLDLIKRSIRMFDKVVVAIFENPTKGPLFSVEERRRLIEESTRGLSNIEIDTFSNTLLVFYAKQRQAHVIVRGLRAIADFEYEFQMTMMNRHLRPQVETIFMMTGESHFYTSSRLVKEVVSLGGNVAGLIPDAVLPRLVERAARFRSR